MRAIADCRRAAELDPHDCEAYIEIGYALALLGRYQEAEAAFQSAINAQPTYYKPYYDAGLFSYEMRDFAAAEKRWLEAVRLNPSHTRAKVDLAYVYLQTGRTEQAQQQVQQSLAIRRTRPQLNCRVNVSTAPTGIRMRLFILRKRFALLLRTTRPGHHWRQTIADWDAKPMHSERSVGAWMRRLRPSIERPRS